MPADLDCLPLEPSAGAEILSTVSRWRRANAIPTVSEDPWILPLLENHPADVVISSGAMVALFNTHGEDFGPHWDIPVIVKEIVSAKGETRRVVFIDKPLLKQGMSVREKNQVYYDAVFESLSATSGTDIKVDFETRKEHPEPAVPQEAPLKDLACENLTYNLWTFGSLQILIRCKIHGVTKDPTSKYNQLRMVGMKTKLEMDYETGGATEEVTIDETARWWIYSYIRPDAHLILGRVDVRTSQIISVERWDMRRIMPTVCAYK